MTDLPVFLSVSEGWRVAMIIPGIIGLTTIPFLRRLSIYPAAALVAMGTMSLVTQGADTELVERETVQATAYASTEIPEIRPMVRAAMRDDRMTLSEFRAIRRVWFKGVERRKAAAAASIRTDGERELEAIVGPGGPQRR